MRELEQLFSLAASRFPLFDRLAVCGDFPGRAFYRHCQLFGRLPVQLVGDDAWQPSDLAAALPHEERTILAVRAGHIPAWRIPGVVCSPLHGFPAPGQERRIRGYQSVWGPSVVELVALPPAGSNDGLRSLMGGCHALGDPFGELADEEPNDSPIPVARDVAGWLRRAMRGAILPLGDAYTQAAYLRELAAPLQVEDLAQGLELERLFKRPERRPAPAIVVLPA